MSQLDSDGVVDGHENEEKQVSHEVVLAIVTKVFVVLANLFSYLERCHVNRVISNKRGSKPDHSEDPKAEELNQEGEQIDIFDLGGKGVRFGPDDLDKVANDHKKRENNQHDDEKLAES